MQSQVYSEIFKGTSNTVMQGTWHLEFITLGPGAGVGLKLTQRAPPSRAQVKSRVQRLLGVYEDGYPRHVGVQLLTSVAVTACPVW